MGQYNITTPEFRLSFWSGADGKENDEGQLRYGGAMLFKEGELLTDMKNMATQIMIDKFGEDKSKWPKGFHKPWRDQMDHDPENPNLGDMKPYEGYKSGCLYVNCNASDQPVECVDAAVKPILEKRKVYSGCFGHANVDMFWFERKNKQGVIVKKGISCSMNCFQKTRDGDPLGGGARPQAASVFKPVAVNTSKGAAAVFADDEEDPMA